MSLHRRRPDGARLSSSGSELVNFGRELVDNCRTLCSSRTDFSRDFGGENIGCPFSRFIHSSYASDVAIVVAVEHNLGAPSNPTSQDCTRSPFHFDTHYDLESALLLIEGGTRALSEIRWAHFKIYIHYFKIYCNSSPGLVIMFQSPSRPQSLKHEHHLPRKCDISGVPLLTRNSCLATPIRLLKQGPGLNARARSRIAWK